MKMCDVCILVKTNIAMRKIQHLLPAKFRSKLKEQRERQSVHSVPYGAFARRQRVHDIRRGRASERAIARATAVEQENGDFGFAPTFGTHFHCVGVCEVSQTQYNSISVWRKLAE